MNAFRIQGQLFCAVAVVVSAISLLMMRLNQRLDQQIELIVLAVLIIALGVPHGALDTIFARQLYGVKTLRGWIAFAAVYVVLAILVVALWFVAPTLFLAGFLAISVFHFSGDLTHKIALPLRALYGGTIIVLPTLLHAEAVTHIFAFLVDQDAAETMVRLLNLLAWPWIAAIVVFASDQMNKSAMVSLEVVCVALLAITASPLIAFTVYFCGMHSTRHIMRTFNYSGKSSIYFLLASAFGPMLVVMLMSFAAYVVLRDTPLDARLIQIMFVGLAALTVPHMALVEQVRVSGWTKGAS